jgi:hypothetical protein
MWSRGGLVLRRLFELWLIAASLPKRGPVFLFQAWSRNSKAAKCVDLLPVVCPTSADKRPLERSGAPIRYPCRPSIIRRVPRASRWLSVSCQSRNRARQIGNRVFRNRTSEEYRNDHVPQGNSVKQAKLLRLERARRFAEGVFDWL